MDALIEFFRKTIDKHRIRMTEVWGSTFFALLIAFTTLLVTICLRLFWYDWKHVFLREPESLFGMGVPFLVIGVLLLPLFRLWRAESRFHKIATFFHGRWTKTYWTNVDNRPTQPNEQFVIRNGNEYWRAIIENDGKVGDLEIVYLIADFKKKGGAVTFTLAGALGHPAATNPNRDVRIELASDGSWEGSENGDKALRETKVIFRPLDEKQKS